MNSYSSPLLVDTLLPKAETKAQEAIKDVVLVLSFAVLTSVFAKISFWIGPVPITGQSLAVLLSGILLGSRRGAFSQLSYLLIGISGIPGWFAIGGPVGLARLLGPTGGYLIGFVFAGWTVGKLAEKGWSKNIKKSLGAMAIGNIVIYLFGLVVLMNFVPIGKLLAIGLFPFIGGDLIKILLAGSILPWAWRFLSKPVIRKP